MIERCWNCNKILYKKNNFAERFKILLDIDLKIILLKMLQKMLIF